jgi:hypothetical protein
MPPNLTAFSVSQMARTIHDSRSRFVSCPCLHFSGPHHIRVCGWGGDTGRYSTNESIEADKSISVNSRSSFVFVPAFNLVTRPLRGPCIFGPHLCTSAPFPSRLPETLNPNGTLKPKAVSGERVAGLLGLKSVDGFRGLRSVLYCFSTLRILNLPQV